MILPTGIQNTVAFVCYRDRDGKERFAGTAFFVLDQGSEFGSRNGYTVTALHVIAHIKSSSKDGRVLLRLNKRNAGCEYWESHVTEWLSPSQDTSFVDLSILQSIPPIDSYDVSVVPLEMVVTQELLNDKLIEIGNQVIIVGLFVLHQGEQRNLPIIRYGNIAMMPDEPLKTNYGSMPGFLIESRSIGGLSGSPVYVYSDKNITTKTPTGSLSTQRILLLGFIHGHYDVRYPITDSLVADTTNREAVNMGIAIVVPALRILEHISAQQKSKQID